jgi:transcriptional regulator with XRE-family HTH domain
MDILAQRLRQVRRAQDLSQQKLEKLSGVHYTTISRIETGDTTHVYAETVRELAKALHVSIDYLMGLHDAGDPTPRPPAPVG